jgi:hypothetical protein
VEANQRFRMANAAEIRAAFREFAGAEGYDRFVCQLRSDSRQYMRVYSGCQRHHPLRFWQEKCWDSFRAQVPAAPTDLDEIREVLFWCHVHDRALQVADQMHAFPEIHHPPGIGAAFASEFPYSYGYYFCSDCIEARDKWIAEHDCQLLRRKTSWDEYCATHGGKTAPEYKKALKIFTTLIEPELRDGDELWEWDDGVRYCGLAIVRDGELCQSWQTPLN